MDSLNVVALTGTLDRSPVMRFDPDSGTARCAGTLRCEEVNTNGSTFRLYVSLEAWGKTAEALVAVQGKLCWRKSTTKQGEEKGTLAVLVGKVSVLVPTGVETKSASA